MTRPGLVLRPLTGADFAAARAVADAWFGRPVGLTMHRLFFEQLGPWGVHAAPSEDPERMVGVLLGLVSQVEPDLAYVHFHMVDPQTRGRGVGRALYEAFGARMEWHGCTRVRALAAPTNAGSLRFHEALGFHGTFRSEHMGPGQDRVVFERDLPIAPRTGLHPLDRVVEAVVCRQADPPPGGDPWTRRLPGIAAEYRRCLLADPGAVVVVAGRPLVSERALGVVERLVAVLCDGGLAPAEALAVLNAVVVWTHGHVQAQLGAATGRVPPPPAPDPARFPVLAAALATTTWGVPDGEFLFGVEALVRGLEAVLTDA